MMKNTFFRVILMSVLLVGVSACSSSKGSLAEKGKVGEISWLSQQFQDDGIFVVERGEPEINFAASLSRRFLLNGREYVDAYVFADRDKAESQAVIYAGYNPHGAVYVHDKMVVIRYTDDMSEISSSLYKHLGSTV